MYSLSFTLIQLAGLIFDVLAWLIIIRCILSFVRHNPYQPIIRFIYDVTEPVMAPFRKLIPGVSGIDFSPILAIAAIELLRKVVISLLIILFR